MTRYATAFKTVLGLALSASMSATAIAGPKNVSSSPREVIQNFPGNIQGHSFIRNDGNYGLAVHEFNKGVTTHYVIDKRTGAVLSTWKQ
jgi:hypothetical protein